MNAFTSGMRPSRSRARSVPFEATAALAEPNAVRDLRRAARRLTRGARGRARRQRAETCGDELRRGDRDIAGEFLVAALCDDRAPVRHVGDVLDLEAHVRRAPHHADLLS